MAAGSRLEERDSCRCAEVRSDELPLHEIIPRRTWQVGYSIDVSPSSKQGSWIKARAYDGFTGWVDANCVRY